MQDFETVGTKIDGVVTVLMTCCDSRYGTVRETIGHVCPPVEDRKRVWVVRAGTDGIGLDLFTVYEATMPEARRAAVYGLRAMDMRPTADRELFTVHALRDGEELPEHITLAGSLIADRPAIDFVPTDEEIEAAVLLAFGLMILAAFEEASREIFEPDPIAFVRYQETRFVRGPVTDVNITGEIL